MPSDGYETAVRMRACYVAIPVRMQSAKLNAEIAD
jgi:hypothetical protein